MDAISGRTCMCMSHHITSHPMHPSCHMPHIISPHIAHSPHPLPSPPDTCGPATLRCDIDDALHRTPANILPPPLCPTKTHMMTHTPCSYIVHEYQNWGQPDRTRSTQHINKHIHAYAQTQLGSSTRTRGADWGHVTHHTIAWTLTTSASQYLCISQ